MKIVSFLTIGIILFTSGCRITEEANPASANFDVPYIEDEITSPGTGQVIVTGSTVIIEWKGFNVKNVSLELWKKKQYNHQTIAQNIKNTGSHTWTVPSGTPGSVSYQIKLFNADNPAYYIYSGVFQIK